MYFKIKELFALIDSKTNHKNVYLFINIIFINISNKYIKI